MGYMASIGSSGTGLELAGEVLAVACTIRSKVPDGGHNVHEMFVEGMKKTLNHDDAVRAAVAMAMAIAYDGHGMTDWIRDTAIESSLVKDEDGNNA